MRQSLASPQSLSDPEASRKVRNLDSPLDQGSHLGITKVGRRWRLGQETESLRGPGESAAGQQPLDTVLDRPGQCAALSAKTLTQGIAKHRRSRRLGGATDKPLCKPLLRATLGQSKRGPQVSSDEKSADIGKTESRAETRRVQQRLQLMGTLKHGLCNVVVQDRIAFPPAHRCDDVISAHPQHAAQVGALDQVAWQARL
jgi:hypothetical protein